MKQFTVGMIALCISLHLRAEDVRTLSDKYVMALGGRERIIELKSIKARGVMTGMGTDLPLNLTWASPNRLRMEILVQGNSYISVFDGTTAASFRVAPSTGHGERLELSKEEATSLIRSARRFNLAEYLPFAKGSSEVEFLGRENVNGVLAFKLRWKTASGDGVTIYLDPISFLELRRDMVEQVDGMAYESESYSADYREVAGIMFAFKQETRVKGGASGAGLRLEWIRTDTDVPIQAFRDP
jgi:hypothetical protein